MAKFLEKTAETKNKAAIEGSTRQREVLLDALAYDVGVAAEHGRCEKLTNLFMGVSRSDADAIRWYLSNLTMTFGSEKTDDNGKTRRINFLTWNNGNKRFEIVNSDEARETREIIKKLSEKELKEFRPPNLNPDVEFHPLDNLTLKREEAADNQFNSWNVLSKAIKRIANNDPTQTALVNSINNMIPKEYRINVEAETKKTSESLAKAKARLERYGYNVSGGEANTNQPEAEATDNVVKVEAA